jgi:hypothetical protein
MKNSSPQPSHLSVPSLENLSLSPGYSSLSLPLSSILFSRLAFASGFRGCSHGFFQAVRNISSSLISPLLLA